VSLFTLVIQNSTLVLVMRYARTLPGPTFLPSTAVVMSELIKLINRKTWLTDELHLEAHEQLREFQR
jgi:hypothetical protein